MKMKSGMVKMERAVTMTALGVSAGLIARITPHKFKLSQVLIQEKWKI